MTLPPIQLLHAFEAAARLGSFKRAAAELHVTPSAVSQQIRTLEEHLEVSLFSRRPRAVRLTRDGAEFQRVAAETLAVYRRGAGEFLAARARQTVRLSTLAFVAYEVLIPAMPSFGAAHPDVDLRLETSGGLVDVAAGEADAAIRFGLGRWPGLAARTLARVEAGLVCAPSLLTRSGEVRRSAVRDGRLVVMPSFLTKGRARERLEAAGVGAALPPRDLLLDSFLATMRAAERGLGVAVGLHPIVRPWIEAGRLVEVGPRFGMRERYWFVCREAERDRADRVAVRRWARAAFDALGSGDGVTATPG